MISPITQMQITFPVTLSRAVIREEVVYLSLSCRLLETRLLQRMRFAFGDIYTVQVREQLSLLKLALTHLIVTITQVSPLFSCDPPSNMGECIVFPIVIVLKL